MIGSGVFSDNTSAEYTSTIADISALISFTDERIDEVILWFWPNNFTLLRSKSGKVVFLTNSFPSNSAIFDVVFPMSIISFRECEFLSKI